jgi:ElaB/YqjD/DUF883 family membrane-anchored ribosome-binding protein
MSSAVFDKGIASVAAEVEHVKAIVGDGAENAVRAAKQTIRRARHSAEDASEELVHQMKRHPLESAGVAFGVGLAAGLAIGMALFRRSRGPSGEECPM